MSEPTPLKLLCLTLILIVLASILLTPRPSTATDLTVRFPLKDIPFLNPPGYIPRRAKNANQPGDYQIVARAKDSTINPGDKLEVELYITGYGIINGAKVSFSPPSHFTTCPQTRYGLAVHPDGRLFFHAFEDTGCAIGGSYNLNQELGYFNDYKNYSSAEEHAILSEYKMDSAPIEISLETENNASPGTHSLKFYLSYFNGQQWKTSSDSVDIEVRDVYKRYELFIQIMLLLLAAIAIVPGIEELTLMPTKKRNIYILVAIVVIAIFVLLKSLS